MAAISVPITMSGKILKVVSKDYESVRGITLPIKAKDVVLKKDAIFAGNYTLGTKKTSVDDIYTVEAGTNLEDMIADLFTDELQPTITQPSLNVTFTNVGSNEIGTRITPKFKITFNPGSYSYGSIVNGNLTNGTGVTLTTLSASDSYGNTYENLSPNTEYTFKTTVNYGKYTNVGPVSQSYNINTTNNYSATQTYDGSYLLPKVKVTAIYSDGNTPVTNLHKAASVQKITAKVLTYEITMTAGYRKTFYYVGTDCTSEINSSFLRSTTSGHVSLNSVDTSEILAIPAGTKRVVYAVMGSKTLKSVIDVEGMGLDIKGEYSNVKMNVDAANGMFPEQYTVVSFTKPEGLAATHHNITFN